jgi:Na+-translocating ferredoxin:NAD+ oxidoreductase RnfG subunit
MGRVAAAMALAATAVSLRAADGITREEALAAVFPGASIRAEQLFLTEQQHTLAAERSGTAIASPLVARYVAVKDGQVIGRAYIDTHTVRTKKETLLISLDAAGRVKRVDVTAFLEPPEYRAPEAWLRQYRDRNLDQELALNRAIRPIAGATLTARATNHAIRRVLAIDQVLQAADPESRPAAALRAPARSRRGGGGK